MTSDRAIGGEFALEPADFCSTGKQPAWPSFGGQHELRCDTGRSALYLALVDWRKRRPGSARAWVPNYVCESVIEAVHAAGYIVNWYEDRPAMKRRDCMTPGCDDVVIVIHYFGFPNAILENLMARRAEIAFGIVEDCVQAPYTNGLGGSGDYAISSLRKWWPAPDGAAVTAGWELSEQLAPPDEGFVSMRQSAKILRGAGLCEQEQLSLIERSEAALSVFPRQCSWVSSKLLDSVPREAACTSRRANWRVLQGGLAGINGLKPLFEDLPDEVVPLSYPVMVAHGRRDGLRDHFRRRRIFCPIHWPAMADWPDESRRLSDGILSLPLDQRYDGEDMERVLFEARNFFS